MTGPVLSTTITLKVVGSAVLPYWSVVLQVTSVVSIWKVVPDAGEQVTVGLGSPASVTRSY